MPTLEFEPGEWIFPDYTVRQIRHDGAIFFVNARKSTIEVAVNSSHKMKKNSWEGGIVNCECYGESLFFITNKWKLYKATYKSKGSYAVEFVRNMEKEETVHRSMILSRMRDDKRVVYRPCDDPTEGILVDLNEARLKELEGYRPVAIHRSTIFYVAEKRGKELVVRAIAPNIITIDSSENYECKVYTTEDSPLVYLLTGRRKLSVLNPVTMELLSLRLKEEQGNSTVQEDQNRARSLVIAGLKPSGILGFCSIIGVHDGKITVVGKAHLIISGAKGNRLFTADAPDELREFEQAALEADELSSHIE